MMSVKPDSQYNGKFRYIPWIVILKISQITYTANNKTELCKNSNVSYNSQDNVVGDATFPVRHNDNYEEFNLIKYSNFAKYIAFFRFQQQI